MLFVIFLFRFDMQTKASAGGNRSPEPKEIDSMTEKVTEKKRHKSPGKPGRYVYGGGLWMDEMVDKMMEQESSGYVGFHCTYKKDLGKQTPGT